MAYSWALREGHPFSLRDFDPRHTDGLSKGEGAARLAALQAELGDLQELCYAAGEHAVLLVLQGMDTSGKDGTIKKVMESVDPQGCRVTAFTAPSARELAHDFLWRVHAVVPERGMFGVFNRSHYEDVLAGRVRALVPETVWRQRYAQINDFERLLVETGTIVVKCFLHISNTEQAERLHARETEPDKRWKLSTGDYKDRAHWTEYMAAYEDALRECSTDGAPWHIIPADRKWFRDVAVADVLVETLRPYGERWARALRERGERSFAELLALRERGEGQL